MFPFIAFYVAVLVAQRCVADDVRATPAVPSSTPSTGTSELKAASNESLVEAPPPPTTQQLDPDYGEDGEGGDDAEADNDDEEPPANDSQAPSPTVRRGYARLAFNNCGEDTDPLFVTGFDLDPNPVQIPGPLSVGIRFRLNENLTSPIAVHLEMQKKLTLLFGLSTWLTIPCLPNGVGSCTYDDICKINLFSKPECLHPKTGEEIPCQCPYHEGEWRLKPTTFKVPQLPPDLPSYLLDGEFVIKATVLRGGEQIGCYSTDVELNL
ncbi:ganglioside GM2 activator-like [Amblyomma americanum]